MPEVAAQLLTITVMRARINDLHIYVASPAEHPEIICCGLKIEKAYGDAVRAVDEIEANRGN